MDQLLSRRSVIVAGAGALAGSLAAPAFGQRRRGFVPRRPPSAPESGWLPASQIPLSDSGAAALVRPFAENRPRNVAANAHVPGAAELAAFHASATGFSPYSAYVTGTPGETFTTGELIQWSSCKWGIPGVWRYAQAVQESNWNQAEANLDDGGGQSFGIMQIKTVPSEDHPGTAKLAPVSTAFNLDYQASILRYYYDDPGGDPASWDSGYAAGDAWAALGAWFSPSPWNNSGAQHYQAQVQAILASRPWLEAGF